MTTKIIINDFSVISKSDYQQSRDSLESVGNKRKTDFDKPLFETDDDMPF